MSIICNRHSLHYLNTPEIGCPFCEIDRLRAELETTKRHMAEDTRDIGALEDEVTALRAELAKAQEEKKEAESAERLWRVELAGQQECTLREMKRAEAAEARIKELEIALSGKTFSYDPDSYQKGMEEVAKWLTQATMAVVDSNYEGAKPYYILLSELTKTIRDRIEEVKNAKS